MSYDVIGDIHGQADKLVALLVWLGYRQRDGAWRHTDCRRSTTGSLAVLAVTMLASVFGASDVRQLEYLR